MNTAKKTAVTYETILHTKVETLDAALKASINAFDMAFALSNICDLDGRACQAFFDAARECLNVAYGPECGSYVYERVMQTNEYGRRMLATFCGDYVARVT